jgi:hypothetical protein
MVRSFLEVGGARRRCADTLSPKATSRPARRISRRIRRTTRRCTPRSISSAASRKTRPTRRTPRRRSRTRVALSPTEHGRPRSKAEAKDNEGNAIEACSDRAGIDAQKTPRAYKGRREAAHCRSLISHSRPAVSVSCAARLGGLCSWSKKYAPLTFATSGEVASHTRVSAPFSGLRATGLRIVIPKFISSPLLRLNPVATAQGGSSSPSPRSHRDVAPVQS